MKQFHEWKQAVQREAADLPAGTRDVVAVVLNYKRPQNIEPIVKSLLVAPSINRVIVSNNNPTCDLSQWINITDPRVEIHAPAERQYTPYRYYLSRYYASPLYLCIDDDLFLLPSQIESLVSHLRTAPEVPHGIFGQVALPEGGFLHAVQREERPVDVINRVYAFTAAHLLEWQRLVRELGFETRERLAQNHWDDLVLSFAGSQKPRIHDIGPYLDCPTQGNKGTAVWREEEFFEQRENIYQRLCSIKPTHFL